MTDRYDVVVIGGGIHGAGVAQAAACAGHSVLLLERTALAAGTSSRSSKLIHGGLRYLEGHDYALVRESLCERSILLRVAPELVRLQPFHIPVYPDTTRRPLLLRLGLMLYAMLGGLRRDCMFRSLPRRAWDSLDGLRTEHLQAVFRYHDAQTDDAGLTRAVMHSALSLGAELACPAEFTGAEIGPHGCAVHYRAQGIDRYCDAAVLVNAGGPWVGSISARITPRQQPLAVELVQGAHLVLDGSLAQGCYYMEAPHDRRAVFLLPWKGHSLLGTTENTYHGDPAQVSILDSEQQYLLEVLRHYFPQHPDKVIGRFAGLRVLPANGHDTFSRSRETCLATDQPQRPRLVSIFGGKLTAYRATAHKVVQLLAASLPQRTAVAHTASLHLTPVD